MLLCRQMPAGRSKPLPYRFAGTFRRLGKGDALFGGIKPTPYESDDSFFTFSIFRI